MKIKKPFICILLAVQVFFVCDALAKKAKGPKDLLKLIEEKGIDIDPNQRKWLEEKAREQEQIARESKEHRKWYVKQRFKLVGRWKKVLTEKIGEADKIEIQTTPYKPNKNNQILHVIEGNDKVQSFLNPLSISEWKSGGYCACHGAALLVFYKGEKRLETLSFHHSSSLRWYNGPWPGDAVMTQKSQSEVPKWFASEGYTAFEDHRQEKISEHKRQKDEENQFGSYFPKKVQLIQFKTFVKNPIRKRLNELDEKYPQKSVSKLYSSMMALGCRGKDVSYVLKHWQEFAIEYPGRYNAEDFANAFEELQDNRQGVYGAACLFFKNEMEGLTDTVNNSLSKEEKISWTIKLVPIVLDSGSELNKVRLLDSIKTINDSRVSNLFLDVARGKVGTEVDYSNMWINQEPGIRATAYLCLASQNQESVKSEIKERIHKFDVQQDKAAMEVALALLGEEGLLKEDTTVPLTFE